MEPPPTQQARPAREQRPSAPPLAVVPELPPRVPEDIEELEEAVCLLGAYCKANGRMKAVHLETIKLLVGALPRLQDAPSWKSALKKRRSVLVHT